MNRFLKSRAKVLIAISAVAIVIIAMFASASAQTRRTLEAPVASITVDGDASDWDGISGLDLTLEAIEGEEVESKAATVKVAHDGEFVYVLMTVDDDYNWNAENPHLSASPSVLWAVDETAGPHMGTDGMDIETSLGMVDIWHWELECGPGEEQGGAVHDPGDGDPGNDGTCNFDDEYSTTPFDREDDNGEGAENSLLGVFTHTDPTDDADGTYTFEMRRPLVTGDAQDAAFAAGEEALMALAYWDADNSPEGWDDAEHVQSSNQDWIVVTLASGGTGGGTTPDMPSTGGGGTAGGGANLALFSGAAAVLLVVVGGALMAWSRRDAAA